MASRTNRITWIIGIALALAVALAGLTAWRQSRSGTRAVIVHPASEPTGVAQGDACRHPDTPPAQPDGATATEAVMIRAHDAVQAYVNRLEAYQACRNAEIDHAARDTAPAQIQAWLDQGNTAVDEAHAMADAFAVQLQRYKDRHGPS